MSDAEGERETSGAEEWKRGINGWGYGLSEGEIFEVLSNERRRYAYTYLKRHGGTWVDLRELSTSVAAWENEKHPKELTTAERKRVQTALQQFHLPKMDDLGFVDYDRTRGTVRLSKETAGYDIYLDIVPGLDVSWGWYYLGLSVLNGVFLGAVWADLGPLAALDPLTVAVFAILTLGASALVHALTNAKQHRLGVGEGRS